MRDAQALLRQIEALPAARVAEVEDFVAFLAAREQAQALTRAAAAAASEPAFAAVWNNADDDAYDEL